MKFYSEKLNKMYSTAAEVVKAEEAYDKKLAEEKAKKEALVNARKTRAEEVDKAFNEAREAYKKYTDLLNAFCKDYGSYHKTFKEGDTVPSLLDWFMQWF